jgi:hypothetical protein
MKEEMLEVLKASEAEYVQRKGNDHPFHKNFILRKASQHLYPKLNKVILSFVPL